MEELVEIVCLECGHKFEVKSNGHSLAMYDQDRSIHCAFDGEKLKCPECGQEQLIFKGYEKAKKI